jgi:hypothetical protein
VKRICLVVAAMAALLIAGVASASATTSAKKKSAGKAVKTTLTCSLKLVTQIPPDDVTVIQGAESGTQYGRAGCAKPLFSGIEEATFVQDESGNLSGKFQQWFNAGTISGTYALTAQDTGPPTSTSFTSASYTGTMTLTSGTGLYRKATGTATRTTPAPRSSSSSNRRRPRSA